MNEFTRDEVIKALIQCADNRVSCSGCPYAKLFPACTDEVRLTAAKMLTIAAEDEKRYERKIKSINTLLRKSKERETRMKEKMAVKSMRWKYE